MSSLRTDPLTGQPVVLVAERQERPNLPTDRCPFCPGGREAPEPYDVHWFPNRWPAMPDGRCEVVLYSPDHHASLGSIGPAAAESVVLLWAERTTALGSRDDVAYVLLFENRGREVGATIDHPHGQIYAYDFVPPVARRELERAIENGCVLCVPPDPALVVATHGDWRVSSPFAPGWPFELLVQPTAHLPDLPAVALDTSLRRGLAAALSDAVLRLDGLFSAPMPYMLWVHQRPTQREDPTGIGAAAHVHVHIAPVLRAPGVIRHVAAAEVGGGVIFNPVTPDEAVVALRATR